jgi:2-dehydropantoate 2-reductase
MRIIIFGAGAIGSAVGGHLALSGAEVVLIGRPVHVDKIIEHGLRFITPIGTHKLKLAAVTAPSRITFQPEDIVFLSVKSQNTAEALRDLRTEVTDIPVFCFQNGVHNEEIASAYFPRVYGVMVRIGGEYVRDGEITVRRDPPGWAVMGRYPQGTDALAESVAEKVRQAGFRVLVTPDVMPYKWGKLMANLANAIGAITNARGEENGRIMHATQDEARQVLSQANIRWLSQEELGREWPVLNEKPLHVLSTESQSSTWQSLARRQGSVETEFLNGEIVRLAKRIGKDAPINAALARITQEMAAAHEIPGKYTPQQLMEILGIS